MSKRRRDDRETESATVMPLSMAQIEMALEEYEELKKARLSATELPRINIQTEEKKKEKEIQIIFELNLHLENIITDNGKRKKLKDYHEQAKDDFFAAREESMVKKGETFPPKLYDFTRFGDKDGNHMTMGEARNGLLYFDEKSNFTGVVFVERWKDEKSKILDPNQKDFIFYRNGEVIDFVAAATGVSRLGQDFPKRLREKEQQLAEIKTINTPAKEALKETAQGFKASNAKLGSSLAADSKTDESKNAIDKLNEAANNFNLANNALKEAISKVGNQQPLEANVGNQQPLEAKIIKKDDEAKKVTSGIADKAVAKAGILKTNNTVSKTDDKNETALADLKAAGDRLKKATDALSKLNVPKVEELNKDEKLLLDTAKNFEKDNQSQVAAGKGNKLSPDDKGNKSTNNSVDDLNHALENVDAALGKLNNAVGNLGKPQAKAQPVKINLDGKNKRRELYEAAQDLSEAVKDMKDAFMSTNAEDLSQVKTDMKDVLEAMKLAFISSDDKKISDAVKDMKDGVSPTKTPPKNNDGKSNSRS